MAAESKRKKAGGISGMTLALVLTDVGALLLALGIACSLRLLLPGTLPMLTCLGMTPFLLLFPCLFRLLRLYPGALLHPAEELKRLTSGVSLGALVLFLPVFLTDGLDLQSGSFLVLFWGLALVGVPAARYGLRRLCCGKSWWQVPVIVVADAAADLPLDTHRVRFSGFVRAALLIPCEKCTRDNGTVVFPDDIVQKLKEESGTAGETRIFALDSARALEDQIRPLASLYPNAVVLIHWPGIPRDMGPGLLDALGLWFRNVLILPGKDWLPSVPSQIVTLGLSFGLVIRRNLADRRQLRLKRCIDLVGTGLAGIFALPLLLVLAALIRLDSPGPVFFRHSRIGQGGRTFEVYKFRTMLRNNQEVLDAHLANNPDAAAEWAAVRKLKYDPRVTRLGRFLRKTSLDELPQIINIFKGDMSLVGPRPIVTEEIERYGNAFSLYTRCPPGITGLWQVSGRSETTYAERVRLDSYYINNWSVWLDIYIILRTIPEVICRRGAW